MDRSPDSPRRRGRYDDYHDSRRGGHYPRSANRAPRTPVGSLFDGPMLSYPQFLDHLADDRIHPSDAGIPFLIYIPFTFQTKDTTTINKNTKKDKQKVIIFCIAKFQISSILQRTQERRMVQREIRTFLLTTQT